MTVQSDIGPFAIVPEAVLRSGISDGAMRLYAELSLMADRETRKAWPSRQFLADKCECSTRTIADRLKELETAGHVERQARFGGDKGRRSSLYLVRYSSQGSEETVLPPQEADFPQNHNQLEPESKNHTLTFNEFWSVYPRRVGKRQAEQALVRALRRAEWDDIKAGLVSFASGDLPEEQFIPHPATWLNRDGWLDENGVSGRVAHPVGAMWDPELGMYA